jgi:hypothetical protein
MGAALDASAGRKKAKEWIPGERVCTPPQHVGHVGAERSLNPEPEPLLAALPGLPRLPVLR